MFRSLDQYYGLFGQDIWSVTPKLNLVVGARYNLAQINLSDLLGGPVNGNNTFAHFNPIRRLNLPIAAMAAGLWQLGRHQPRANATRIVLLVRRNPCSLLNFFVGDPPLQQVVANTFEIGARGNFGKFWNGAWSWNADAYHTTTNNDIIFETTPDNPNLAFFVNAGKTLRKGQSSICAMMRGAAARTSRLCLYQRDFPITPPPQQSGL